MQIFVEFSNGKTITLNVEPSSSIEDVKAMIHIKVGVVPDQQRLMYASNELGDDRTLGDCDVKAGSILKIVFWTPGAFCFECCARAVYDLANSLAQGPSDALVTSTRNAADEVNRMLLPAS